MIDTERHETHVGPLTLTVDQYFFGYQAGRNLDLDASLQRFLRAQLRTGGWHPEDDPVGLVSGETCEPTFADDVVDSVAADIETIREAGIDPCGLVLAAFPAHLPMPKWSEDA